MARKINMIALSHRPSQFSLDGLLISGLEVRVLPGSPKFSRKRFDSINLQIFATLPSDRGWVQLGSKLPPPAPRRAFASREWRGCTRLTWSACRNGQAAT